MAAISSGRTRGSFRVIPSNRSSDFRLIGKGCPGFSQAAALSRFVKTGRLVDFSAMASGQGDGSVRKD